jgi:hypothetical protein
MSAAATDFERQLREALDKATANAPEASKDLVRLASEAADAVSKVTEGAATLELVPIVVDEDPCTTYQLQFRRNRSEAQRPTWGFFACLTLVIPSSDGARGGIGRPGTTSQIMSILTLMM